jgi:hypothetical protein
MKNPMKRLKTLLCVLPLFVTVLPAASGPFTINQVMSAPFASAPVPSPNGAKVAWLEDEQGKRNVYVATAPDWKATKLTNFAQDDGQDIGEVAWAHDGSYVVFVRGGDLENGGDNPNPDLQPNHARSGDLVCECRWDGTEEVNRGSRARCFADWCGLIAFLRGGQIFAMLPTGEAK